MFYEAVSNVLLQTVYSIQSVARASIFLKNCPRMPVREIKKVARIALSRRLLSEVSGNTLSAQPHNLRSLKRLGFATWWRRRKRIARLVWQNKICMFLLSNLSYRIQFSYQLWYQTPFCYKSLTGGVFISFCDAQWESLTCEPLWTIRNLWIVEPLPCETTKRTLKPCAWWCLTIFYYHILAAHNLSPSKAARVSLTSLLSSIASCFAKFARVRHMGRTNPW